MEEKTIQSLEIKRERLRGIRPLTKEEIKVKAEIDMLKYVGSVIKKMPIAMNYFKSKDYPDNGEPLISMGLLLERLEGTSSSSALGKSKEEKE